MLRTPIIKMALWLVAFGSLVAAATQQVRLAWEYSKNIDPHSVSDALPIFLGARAVRTGYDPTNAEHLDYLYQYADIHVSKALFSVLYPASLSVMLQPLGLETWPVFLHYWRLLILIVFTLGIAAVGTVGLRGWHAPITAALAIWIGFIWCPYSTNGLALGQANLIIVGIFGMMMAAAARSWFSISAVVAVLGAAVKLVPALLAWPLFFGRRWRALGVMATAGVITTGVTFAYVEPQSVLANLWTTLTFQQSVEPHWLQNFRMADWVRYLGNLRRPGMWLLTLTFTGWSCWRTRSDAERHPETIALCLGLLATTLAIDSAGVGKYYAMFCLPLLICIVTWPLTESAPRWSWLCLPIAWIPWWAQSTEFGNLDIEPRMVVASYAVWVGGAARLLHLTHPWTVRSRAIGAGVTLIILLQAWVWTFRPPNFGPKSLPPAAPGSITTPDSLPPPPIPPPR